MKKILLVLALIFGALNLNAADFKTLTDMTGSEVKIPAKVDKIAALWHANNQIILVLGGMDKVVTTTDQISKNKWFARIYPRLAKLPAALNGNDIQIEELVKLAPDVVIVSNKNFQASLAKEGFSVVNALFKDYEDMRKSVLLTAEVIGGNAPARAKELNDYLDKNIALVSAKTDKIPTDKRPKVLHIVNGSNLLKVDGTKSMIDTWIKYAGGTNAIQKEGNMFEITAEEILNANPDIIIVGGADNQKSVAKIYADPAFSGLKAVQNKKVFGNPKGVFSWDRYGAEAALQILWAAKTIQPEIFADIDVKAETKAFYKKFMNYDLSDAEFGYILNGLNPDGSK
ncbi:MULTISPECIES: ABC transporter substrate-binding protein [Campylobacter]|uniref:ABC transporter substrate-binding protein n=1 Tax=Campylobacter TaxID=194 RepID=UPI00027A3677|nr:MULTISPECIES: ABC transporter substrate-binding protein [Campylobacter]EJP75354.1 oligopeptide ABC transporter, oligopeptide-binding protein [Campylobacter sp. FOBRC14]